MQGGWLPLAADTQTKCSNFFPAFEQSIVDVQRPVLAVLATRK